MSRAFSRFLNALAFMAAMWLLFFAMVALAKIAEKPQHLDRFKVSLPDSAVAPVATVHAQPPNTGLALTARRQGASPRNRVSPARSVSRLSPGWREGQQAQGNSVSSGGAHAVHATSPEAGSDSARGESRAASTQSGPLERVSGVMPPAEGIGREAASPAEQRRWHHRERELIKGSLARVSPEQVSTEEGRETFHPQTIAHGCDSRRRCSPEDVRIGSLEDTKLAGQKWTPQAGASRNTETKREARRNHTSEFGLTVRPARLPALAGNFRGAA